MFGIFLFFLVGVAGVFGIAIAIALSMMLKQRRIAERFTIAAMAGILVTISPLLFFYSAEIYANREQSPEAQWEEEFGYPPSSKAKLTNASINISADRYWKFFTFHSDEETVRTFAKKNGFIELNSEEKLARYNIKFQNRKSAFSKPCEDYLEFEANPYKGHKTDYFDFPNVWMRHCLSTQETYVNIIL